MYFSEGRLWWYIGLQDLLLRYIKKYCKSTDSYILDAGCGTGKNIEIIKACGYKVFGIDISENAIEFCHKRNIFEVSIANITNIPFRDNFFDVIFSMDVIHNLDDYSIKRSVKEFYRVLKPSGVLIINCAALEWLRSQHDDIVNLRKRFTKKEIIGLFSDFDFEIIKLSYRVFFLFIPVALIKIVKKIIKKISRRSYSDQWLPPYIFNWLLTKIQLFENKIIYNFYLPIGSSLFIVLKK